ncbi:hypothetical protein EDI_172560 [Entamoeba dispar SAW760]|uniref:Peptidase S74 domain-containing protein n=1 Tax=Entamoeba dispar (strain ATCC PRA-260 / SAW760) TaxID=370354 RepID=B0EIP8_ENTDS|nr:uncharacterized protein EDI_172560 [Entamoeba dispar SAW760]EDR25599.1 hypothetical protein EDI_172560 [Entamoeba dispar SAW760]|eukprot:EDR25599.1 hypothetical protein EDI_172560 [Entamoeba dispar SAW760]
MVIWSFKMEHKTKRVRFKEYRCIYPGCNEGLKTKYNCLSHIWDMHIRTLNNTQEPFKSIKDKKTATKCCLPYLKFEENAITNRKRRPYDYSDLLGQERKIIEEEEEENEIDLSNNDINIIQSNSPPQINISSPHQNNPMINAIGMYQSTFLTDGISTQIPNQIQDQYTQDDKVSGNRIIINPITYELINSCGEDFIRIYYINQNIRRLHVFGEIFAENGFLQRSDQRYKKDIKKISNALEKIMLLTGRSYKYLNDKQKRFGFIAQELKEIIPEAVKEDEDGTLSIEPLALLPFIIESLKELNVQLKDVQHKTLSIRRFTEVTETVLKEIEKTTTITNKISLGPPIYVAGCGLLFGTLAIIIALNGNFPFIWGFFMLCSLSYWISFQMVPNGQWDNNAILAHFILLNIGLACVAVTFLIGSLLQVFLCVYSAIMVILWGARKWLDVSFSSFFIVSFILCCIACFGVFIFQPTFSCDVSTPMMRSVEYPQNLEYKDWSEVKFNLTSEIPWNCFDPRFVVNGKTIKFQSGDSVLSAIAKEGTVTPDTVDVKLVCSSIEYKCNEYSLQNKR